MIRKNSFSPKYLLAVFVFIFVYGFLVSPVFCQDRVVKGKLDVPFDTGFFSDEPDDSSKAKALEKAKLAAWKKYTSELSTARAKLYEKLKKQVLENLDDYVTEITSRGFRINKEDKTLRVAYRATINEAAFETLLQSSSVASGTASGEGSLFSFIFVARQTTEEQSFSAESKRFDPRRTTVRKTESMNAADESAQTGGGSSAVSSSQTSASKVTTGGSTLQKSGTTIKRATQRKYNVQTSLDVDVAMGETLTTGGFEVVNYDDVVSECGGAEMTQIEEEFINKSQLSRATRKAAINGAKECEVKYFAIGTMDRGMANVTASGELKVNVKVTAQVWNISKRMGRRVASINIVNVGGFGNDDEEAYLNALINASKDAATEIVSQLNLKGLN
jgi:hypothetical protein